MQIQVNTDSHIENTATLSGEVEAAVHHALGRFSDRITRVAVYLSDENSREKFGEIDKRCVIEARLGGLRPVTVSHHGSSVDQAISGAASKLAKTLKRTLGRRGSLVKRGAQKSAELIAAAPVLARDVETGKQEHFIETLRPLLAHLGDYARRELRIRGAQETVYAGQLNVGELLDELVARAWLQIAARPSAMPLALWLTKILDEILDEHTERDQPIQRSLQQQSSRPSAQKIPHVDDQEWWVALLDEDQEPASDDQIISRHSAWAEEFIEAEELVFRIHKLLGDLPKPKRHAFVLHVLEGFEQFEIAMLQDRPETEVRADVEAARHYLRQQLRAGTLPESAAEEAKLLPAARAGNP